jgi:hypothetical protein
MADIIYVLINEAMPGYVKIGRTSDDVKVRIAQLSQPTSVPLPFECYFAVEVPSGVTVEKTLHALFSEQRPNPKREFFKIAPEKVVLALQIGNFKEVTPETSMVDAEDQKALNTAKSKKSNIKLEAISIHIGEKLYFSRDESVIATVIENNKVEFNGEDLSLSAAALKILKSMGYKTPTASGSDYWMYEGELLSERRTRLENEKFSSIQISKE